MVWRWVGDTFPLTLRVQFKTLSLHIFYPSLISNHRFIQVFVYLLRNSLENGTVDLVNYKIYSDM